MSFSAVTSSGPPPPATTDGFTSALLSGDVESAIELISHLNITVNSANTPSGLLPIHVAASRGHLDLVQALCEKAGAVIDLGDKEDETALGKAAYNGHIQVCQYLITNYANVNRSDRDGWTPLHNCASRGHTAIAKLLLEAGANVSSQSKTGQTALMNAAAKGYLDIVNLVLTFGANPTTQNNFGDTAYDLAAQNEEAYIAQVLETAETEWYEKHGVTPPMSHSAVIHVLHENQRCSFLSSKFSAQNLTKADYRGNWSTGQIIRSWFWLTDWKVDLRHPNVDPFEGWQYAKSFDDDDEMWTPEMHLGSTMSMSGWVRRRRWIRVRKRRVDVSQLSSDVSSVSVSSGDGDDYVGRATSVLVVSDDESDLSKRGSDSLKAELDSYGNALQILLGEIRRDTNVDRKKTAMNLVANYLQRSEGLQDEIYRHETQGNHSDQASNAQQTSTRSTADNESDDEVELSPQALQARRRAKGKEKAGVASLPFSDVHGVPTLSQVTVSSGLSEATATANRPSLATSLIHISAPMGTRQGNWPSIINTCNEILAARSSTAGRTFQNSTSTAEAPSTFARPDRWQHRVCDSCYNQLTCNESPLPLSLRQTATMPHTSGISSTLSFLSSRSNSELLSPRPESTDSDASSVLGECPVCGTRFDVDFSEGDIEAHVGECLRKISSGGKGMTINGNRYVVQILNQDWVGHECAICFEDFVKSQRIARLNCLCVFHQHCIESWFSRSKPGGCPFGHMATV
ncbi:hypothetical protein SeMB42_g06080 [Synchytrium endobioticum]|uniref:RING-type domain-containing protein n=1 Tax=Synchytrium endobioticum TaxID=286115 RepID=A0A507CMV0_9FUNG|nr:hypothetical protein SeMB42_g06080 [Synchytrium endobioticum]